MQKFVVFVSILIYMAANVSAEEVHTYGPIKKGEMLWSIAAKISPPSVSRHQVILALQKANPHAFRISCNINSLKVGESLRIPSIEEIQALSRSEARKEFNRQNDQWKVRYDTPIVCSSVVTSPPVNQAEEGAKSPIPGGDSQLSTTEPAISTAAANSDIQTTEQETLVGNVIDWISSWFSPTVISSWFSLTTIIILVVLSGLFAAVLIVWLLYNLVKRNKAEGNDGDEDYVFSEPIDEMPLRPVNASKNPN